MEARNGGPQRPDGAGEVGLVAAVVIGAAAVGWPVLASAPQPARATRTAMTIGIRYIILDIVVGPAKGVKLMAMPTLGYALLAVLARRPGTAYELARRARVPLGYFWTAQYGQVHGQLRLLAEAGLLSVTAEPGPGPHDRNVYAVTDRGRAVLADWVGQPPQREPSRDELMLKAYAIWLADPLAARDLLRGQAAQHRRRLAEYEAIEAEFAMTYPDGRIPLDSPDFGSTATLRYGLGYERHRAEWCDWLAGQLVNGSPAT